VSRHDITLISLLFHIPAITFWVGLAMWDVFATMTPGLADEQRVRLIGRMKAMTLVLIAIIMVTGIWQTLDNPFSRVDSYSTLEALRENTTYGKALFVKHIFVIATFFISIFVRFFLASKAEASIQSDGTIAATQSRYLTWAVLLNLAVTLAAVLSAARMTIELH
jgi:putative copper export protein